MWSGEERSSGLRITWETVVIETPADSATSRIVTLVSRVSRENTLADMVQSIYLEVLRIESVCAMV